MSKIDYFIDMYKSESISGLLNAYEEETGILQDIMGYDDNDEKGRLLNVQRDHIEALKILIDRKS